MKRTHRCPKCHHDEVLYVPQLADRDDGDVVRPFVLHVKHYDWKDDLEMGRIEAYACRNCGFTELYTRGVSSLPLDRMPGARVLTPKDDPIGE